MEKKHVRFLLVRPDGAMRVVARRHTQRDDEVAYRVTVRVPTAYGAVAGDIALDLPDKPEVDVDEKALRVVES